MFFIALIFVAMVYYACYQSNVARAKEAEEWRLMIAKREARQERYARQWQRDYGPNGRYTKRA